MYAKHNPARGYMSQLFSGIFLGCGCIAICHFKTTYSPGKAGWTVKYLCFLNIFVFICSYSRVHFYMVM